MSFLRVDSPDAIVKDQIAKCEAVKTVAGEKLYWQVVAEFAKQNPWFLARYVLEWAWLDEELHARTLLGFYEENEGRDTAVFIPRGFGKTLTTALRIIHRFVNDPDAALLFVSATEDFANDFGTFISGIILGNTKLHKAFPGIFPTQTAGLARWGKNGYDLPNRKPRIDPSLLCLSLKSNTTGKHPDVAFVDDLITRRNNTPKAYQDAELLLKELRVMLPSHGVIHITGTRWHDADPYGKIIRNASAGKQGLYKVLVMSCWEDDNPAKPCIWPRKIRWNMTRETGYNNDDLERQRKPEHEGGLGAFFDAQMRNDPSPEERQDIKLSYVNIYDKDEMPKLSHVRAVGIEITGGGRLVFKTLQDKTEKLRIPIPLVEMQPQRNTRGETKADKIKAVIEPYVSTGRLWIQRWMHGDGGTTIGSLGYELKRLGVATNDDIVDALHCIPLHLSKGGKPQESDLAHLYLSCDLAWTEDKKSDWTVLLAGAIDHRENFWVIDYERFQSSVPTIIADRIIEFYQKWTDEKQTRRRTGYRFAMSYK